MIKASTNSQLKVFSSCLIILALINVCNVLTSILSGELSAESISAAAGVDLSLAMISVIATISVSALILLMELGLAYVGIRRANGKGGKGRAHIVIAFIALVFVTVNLISIVTNCLQTGVLNLVSLMIPLLSFTSLLGYIYCAKQI